MILDKAVALITGGAQGFGKEFARCLLGNGTRVVVADMNKELGNSFQEECSKVYGQNKMKFVYCDVTNSQELNRTFELAKTEFGGLDIVCNNAGIISTKTSDVRPQIAVNLTAVIEGTYKGIELMSKSSGGNGGLIVNVASAAGFQMMPGAPVYTSTKHAVVAFTRSFKHLPIFATDGVRVNCICPFFCDTAMLRSAEEENPEMKKNFEALPKIQIKDVVKAFMQCVEDDNMNAKAVAIMPPDNVYTLVFPPAVPKL